MEKIDFKIELEKKEYNKIFEQISNKTIELAKKIAEMKNIKLDSKTDKNQMFSEIEYVFGKKIARFRDMRYLVRILKYWEEDESSEIRKIENCIKKYNSILLEKEQYEKTEKQIEKLGYLKLLNEKKEKLIKLFKEMLEYKNKKYDNKWNFEQFIDVISQNYNSYSEELNYVKEAMNFKMINYRDEEEPICVNEIEIVIFIDDLYNILTYKSDDYKNYANFYRDFELKEGQTYEDLYELEEEKFVQLFKEMLDFINVKYEEDDFIKLKWKVIENYPHYREILLHLISNNPNTTYIKKLDYMENVYEKIKSGYKEYIEKYILILNKNESMQNVILKRKLENEGYEVIAKNENVVFIKKSENAQELEEQEIELILSLANKQLNMGVILVDITKEIKEILGTSNEDRNLKNLNYKKKIEWMIRQAFTKALIEKNKNATSYDEN